MVMSDVFEIGKIYVSSFPVKRPSFKKSIKYPASSAPERYSSAFTIRLLHMAWYASSLVTMEISG